MSHSSLGPGQSHSLTNDSNEKRYETRASLVTPSHGQFYVSFISPPVVKKYLNVAKQWFPHYTQKVRSEKCFLAYKDNSTLMWSTRINQEQSFRDKWTGINMEQAQDSWRLFQTNFQFTGIQNRQPLIWFYAFKLTLNLKCQYKCHILNNHLQSREYSWYVGFISSSFFNATIPLDILRQFGNTGKHNLHHYLRLEVQPQVIPLPDALVGNIRLPVHSQLPHAIWDTDSL